MENLKAKRSGSKAGSEDVPSILRQNWGEGKECAKAYKPGGGWRVVQGSVLCLRPVPMVGGDGLEPPTLSV